MMIYAYVQGEENIKFRFLGHLSLERETQFPND